MNRIFKTSALMLGVMMMASCGSKGSDKASGKSAPTEPAQPVEKSVAIQVAAREQIPYVGIYPATVQANVVNNIASQAAGRIRKINVEIGDFVSAGQVLAELDRVQLEQAAFKLKNQADELERVRQLLAEGGISQSDYESLELSYKVAKSSYDNLEENTILRSPVSGVVTARNYDVGDMYAMSQPIFTVQQIVPVKLLVPVSESDYTKVKRGDEVKVTADALPGKEFSGKVVRLYPVMDATTHTFNVEVTVRNERRELRPGMYVRASVNFGSAENIAVPDAAVVKQQGSGVKSVYVVSDEGTAVNRVVELGRHFDSKYEILSGLEPGEKVVVKGQNSLRSGDKLKIVD